MEADAQSMCERLLNLDDTIMYSGYLNASGSMVGEATKNSISAHERLTIMVLPIHPSNSSVVIATAIGSNITAVVEKTKAVLASRSPTPLLFTL